MRLGYVVVAVALGCGSKQASPTAGSATTGSATAVAAIDATAPAGSGSAVDPKIAALSAQDKHTCAEYAGCKVERLVDDDPDAKAKQPQFLNACLTAWVALAPADQAKITTCADANGACGATLLGCFDSLKLPN